MAARDDEVLLRPTTNAVAPKLRCSNCGFERAYYYWYKKLDFLERCVNCCPGCGYRIAGVTKVA